MDQKLKGYAVKNAENKQRLEINQRDNRGQQPPFKRQNVRGQNVARAYTAGNNDRKPYNGPLPLCNKCKLHHEGPCTVRCGKSDCPKLKDQNRGNKAGNKNGVGEARGKAYVLGGGDTNPDSNVVKGHPFNIDLMPVELESFDAIIGMDWLANHHAVIVCDEKIVRIPYGDEVLIVQGTFLLHELITHDHDLHDLPPSHGGTMTVTHEAPVIPYLLLTLLLYRSQASAQPYRLSLFLYGAPQARPASVGSSEDADVAEVDSGLKRKRATGDDGAGPSKRGWMSFAREWRGCWRSRRRSCANSVLSMMRSFILTCCPPLLSAWLSYAMGGGLLAMSTLNPGGKQPFGDVVKCALARGKAEAVEELHEKRLLTVPAAQVPGYNDKAYEELVAAMEAMKLLELPHIAQLERDQDYPIDVIMAGLTLARHASEGAEGQPDYFLKPDVAQLQVPIFSRPRDILNPFALEREIPLKESLEAHAIRLAKKKGVKGKAILCGVGAAHIPRSDGVPVSVATVLPKDSELLGKLEEAGDAAYQVGRSEQSRCHSI
ncbi:putative reverse transcriptase domain-containing protein [Tanacetum coccineum]